MDSYCLETTPVLQIVIAVHATAILKHLHHG